MSTVTTQLNSGATPIAVTQGGTGVNTFTTAYTPICAGMTATGDLQPVSGTGLANSGWILTSNGASALPTFQLPFISVVSVTLNTAAVQGMYASPVQILAAQGTHTLIVPYAMVCQYVASTGFGGGSTSGYGPILQYGNTAHAGGDICFGSLLTISGSISQIAYGAGYNPGNGVAVVSINPSSDGVNQGIYASNDTAAYTSGTGSSLIFTLYYNVLTTTV